jgi:iron complex outermembrane receptor protein
MKRLFLFAALASTVIAQGAKKQEVEMVSRKPVDSLKTVELQDVQVRSTRASKKTPIAFTDMNREQIQQLNYGQDVPYLLSLTPSVTTSSDAGNGIGYTTLRIRGTAPERINITANGIPMNDAESNQLFWVNMGDFASSVQTMQIQRGVGTSTNGAGAFGATVNMQTENIGMHPFAGVDISGGSYYSHKETVRFGTGIMNNHWGIQGRLSNIGSKGYINRASTKLNSYFLQAGYFSDNTAVKLITYNGIEETYHAWDYTSHYTQATKGRTYNPCGYMGKDAQGNELFYDNQTDNYHQQNYQLIWNQRLSQLFKLNAALHYTKGKGYYEQYKRKRDLEEYLPLSITESGMVSDLVQQKKMDNDFYGAVASLLYDNYQGLQATIGGGWNKYVGDHFGLIKWMKNPPSNLIPDQEYYRDNAKKTDFNLYGKISYELLRGMSVFADLQYRSVNYKMEDPADWYKPTKKEGWIFDETYNFFNPKVGINYQWAPQHRAFLSYAIAHKEPVRNNFQNNYNAELEKPRQERLNDLEFGYQYQSEMFSAGATFYWMDYKDQFVLTGEIDNIGEAITRNLPKSFRLGVELEAAWKPIDWFRWDVNATFSRNRVKDIAVLLDDYTTTVTLSGENPLAFSPDVIANSILNFNYQGFRAQVQNQFVGDQHLTNTGFSEMLCKDEQGNDTYETLLLKKHFVTNIDLSYSFDLKQCGVKEATVGVTLYNLFSTKFDNNGWAAPQYQQKADGTVVAVNTWGVRDDEAVGFAPSAPFNMMARLSLNF